MTDHRPGADDLERRVAAALRSREPSAAATASAADRVAAALADADGRAHVVPLRRVGKIAAAGVVTSTLAVVGATAAAAANPYSGFAVAVEHAASAVGLEWSAMPEGYTRDQYETFWGAGYTVEDVQALADLWQTDETSAKAQAGQLMLDGQPVPVAPGSVAAAPVGPWERPDPSELPSDPMSAYFEAGYSLGEAEQLAALWDVDVTAAKSRAGELLLADQDLPVTPAP